MNSTEQEILADTENYAEHFEQELDSFVKQTKDFVRCEIEDLRDKRWSTFQLAQGANPKNRLEHNLKAAWRCIDILHRKLQEAQMRLKEVRSEV